MGELFGVGKRGLIGGAKTGPVAVKGGNSIVGDPGGGKLVFLMAQSVVTVVRPTGDPEELHFEGVVEGQFRIGFPAAQTTKLEV